jgi:hypothetical protein
MGILDKISFSSSNVAQPFTGIGGTTDGLIATAALVTATTVGNSANLMRGSWVADATNGTGTFIFNAAGADILYTYDADAAAATIAFRSVVLVGNGAVVTGGAHAFDTGVITLTLS